MIRRCRFPRSRGGRFAATLALALALGVTPREVGAQAPGSSASAREPSPADIKLANDLYKAGHEHVKESNWPAARDAFARAYELYPRPIILSNLAATEVQTGRIVAGVEHYRQVLKQPTGMSASEIELVTRAMSAAEARLAHVRIEVDGSGADDHVEVDGNVLSTAALGVDYPVDPGKHLITASRPGFTMARSEVVLKEGESKQVRLVPVRISEPPPPPPAKPESKGLFSSPWFWVVTGTVVVGAAALTVCLAAVCVGDDGYTGNLGRVNLP